MMIAILAAAAMAPQPSLAPRFAGVEIAGLVALHGDETDALLANPGAVEPFALAVPVKALWQRGDRLQAAFWYYFWQIRTGPWAKHDRQKGALRGALGDSLGPPINEWIFGDIDVLTAVVERVIAFERRVPLFAGRPAGVSEADWLALVEKMRTDYARGFAQVVPQAPEDRREFAEQRKRNGLSSGPLKGAGAPLKDEWR